MISIATTSLRAVTYTELVLYVLVALFVIAIVAAVAWFLANDATVADDDPQGWPITEAEYARRHERDITIGRDQHVAERLNALRRIQTNARLEEERRASARISQGW